MRWTSYLETLPTTEQERLVNLLTVAFARISRAVQLPDGDTETVEVVAALTAAYDLLLVSQQLLAPDSRPHMVGVSYDAMPVLPVIPWQRFRAGLAPARQEQLERLFQQLVHRARVAGELMLDDAELSTISCQLQETEHALLATRRLLLCLLLPRMEHPPGPGSAGEE